MKALIAVLLVLLLALQARLWFGSGGIQELTQARSEQRGMQQELVRLRDRNQALAAEVADLKSGLDAIEERARTDLGMIDEGEVFYQFIRDTRSEIQTPNRAHTPAADNNSPLSATGPAEQNETVNEQSAPPADSIDD